ncbi:16S rRNA (guanine(966)-N(2))-methyltransferase RsmD [Mycobacterium sp. Soil538]|nr:16S rRNA (guanine(966)-N(2))-methyltransferase RsmD [Mycobacterium sp. Soil538]
MPQHGTRPTTDRVRESLFNLLAVRIDFTGIDVVDLYAGSGALGLEALSRGARSALFVESDARAAAVIARNIASLGVRGATVRRAPVAAVVAGAAGAPADLVLADPPYAITTGEVTGLVAALADHGWVADGSVVVVERPTSVPQIDWPDGWSAWKSRRYGDTRVELAQRA